MMLFEVIVYKEMKHNMP